ncbi:MAG: ABC transporter ATP-binding protein, partial [Chloroflexota bacterium]
HDPQMVFLDEPTNGLDPQGRDEMLDLVNRIHRMMGITVVLSSHILDDIERVCDYVVILDHGRLVASQPIAAETASTDLLVRIDGDPRLFLNRLSTLGLAASMPDGGAEILVASVDVNAQDLVRDAAADLGCGIRELRGRTRSLEDLYFENVDGGVAR